MFVLVSRRHSHHDSSQVILQCRQVLIIDEKSVKAQYRMGLAYTALDNFEEARTALLQANALQPSNGEVKEALAALKTAMEGYKVRAWERVS